MVVLVSEVVMVRDEMVVVIYHCNAPKSLRHFTVLYHTIPNIVLSYFISPYSPFPYSA